MLSDVNNNCYLSEHNNGNILSPMKLGDRIRERRKELKWSQQRLAEEIKKRTGAQISQPGIKRIEDGGGTSILVQIARTLGVRPEWLSDGTEPKLTSVKQDSDTTTARQLISTLPNANKDIRPILAWDEEEQLPEDLYVFLPRLSIKTSAGNGKLVWEIEEKGQRQAFRKSFVTRMGIDPERSATVVAEGDSMNDRIQDGDSLLVDFKENTVANDRIYVFIFKDEWFIKRLFKQPGGGLRVVSDNRDKNRFPDWFVPSDDMQFIEIVARVKGLAGGVM